MRVLDLACGTGDLAMLAAAAGSSVVGLDFTPRMIELARIKPDARAVQWLVGDMGALPVGPSSVDVVTVGYGLRNVSNLEAALVESRQVLKPGGLLCCLDFDRPERPWTRAIYLTYLTVVGSVVGLMLHGDPDTYRYIPASIRRYPGARRVAALMERAGFTDVRHHAVFAGFMAIHVAKKGTIETDGCI
jgi:demethylmenaquinone methyltransferase/2-methoxy-6-polyprenyl-1,4-benzoquinol methylase